MIEFCGLFAGYAQKTILSDVSLHCPDGSVTAIVGPNGCGKSTLLKSVLSLATVQKGRILVDGLPLDALPPRKLAQHAAYLPQSRNTPNITAGRMVLHGRFPYLSYPRRYRPADLEAARHAMARVSAEELRDLPMTELSGGQRQRIYLATALAQDTQNILMDEPVTYLDIAHQLSLMRLARELAAEGKSVIMVLHDLCLALRYADRIALFDGGRLLQTGTPEELYAGGQLAQVFRVSIGCAHSGAERHYYIAEA